MAGWATGNVPAARMVESKRRLPRIITASLGTSGPLRSILSRTSCPHDTREVTVRPALRFLYAPGAVSAPGLPHGNQGNLLARGGLLVEAVLQAGARRESILEEGAIEGLDPIQILDVPDIDGGLNHV